jgi:hypothetical protein
MLSLKWCEGRHFGSEAVHVGVRRVERRSRTGSKDSERRSTSGAMFIGSQEHQKKESSRKASGLVRHSNAQIVDC